MKQNCGNCKWAEFQKNKAGRDNPARAGKCLWPVPDGPVPLALSHHKEVTIASYLHKSSVWTHFENCPTWEAK